HRFVVIPDAGVSRAGSILRCEPEEAYMSQQHVVAVESRGVVDPHQQRQLSRGGIVRVWAAAAGPMAVLSWLVAPLLATRLTGPAARPHAPPLCPPARCGCAGGA